MYNQYIIRKCSDTRKPINISAHVKYTCIHDMNEKISHKNYIMWEKNICVSHSIAISYYDSNNDKSVHYRNQVDKKNTFPIPIINEIYEEPVKKFRSPIL